MGIIDNERKERKRMALSTVIDVQNYCEEWLRLRPFLRKWLRGVWVDGDDTNYSIIITVRVGVGLFDQKQQELSWSARKVLPMELLAASDAEKGALLHHILRSLVQNLVEAVSEPPNEPVSIYE